MNTPVTYVAGVFCAPIRGGFSAAPNATWFHRDDAEWNTFFKNSPRDVGLPEVFKSIRICRPDSYAGGCREWHSPCGSNASTALQTALAFCNKTHPLVQSRSRLPRRECSGGRRVTDASDINASARRESGDRRGNTIVRTARGCRRKEVNDMNKRTGSIPAASHEVPARLPVQTETLTAGQTTRISGGDAGLGRLIRNLVAEIFGERLPEPDVPSGTL